MDSDGYKIPLTISFFIKHVRSKEGSWSDCGPWLCRCAIPPSHWCVEVDRLVPRVVRRALLVCAASSARRARCDSDPMRWSGILFFMFISAQPYTCLGIEWLTQGGESERFTRA